MPFRYFPKTPALCAAILFTVTAWCGAQSIAFPWSGHGHDAQHSGISSVAAQPMNRIRWHAQVDLNAQYSGTELLIHYGSPLSTRANTIIFPVKTGSYDGFEVQARNAADGSVIWTQPSDYTLPAHDWVPSFGPVITPKNRVYFAGSGGTVYYRDTPDVASGATGQIAFYGLANYQADPDTKAAFDANVKINTPIATDRYGNIFFGFVVSGATTPALQGGIARIAPDGTCSVVSASAAAQGDATVSQVVHNCTPALSNDHRTLYAAVSTGGAVSGIGWLVSLDSRTLAPIARVRLKDPHSTTQGIPNDAYLPDDGSATPTVGPDGDVYFGVLENPLGSNHLRGWLLHFDSTLSQTKTPGVFGWDDTASVVPASAVPAPNYTGSSSYLLLTKYNNYVEGGGDGVNKIAVLDPNATQSDAVTGATVMKEVITQAGPTPDTAKISASTPNAVREWCVNTVAIDPAGKCAIVNSEDGNVYRWNFATNTLVQSLTLGSGIGEAYTPTMLGVDGTVYAISNAVLFAIGQ